VGARGRRSSSMMGSADSPDRRRILRFSDDSPVRGSFGLPTSVLSGIGMLQTVSSSWIKSLRSCISTRPSPSARSTSSSVSGRRAVTGIGRLHPLTVTVGTPSRASTSWSSSRSQLRRPPQALPTELERVRHFLSHEWASAIVSGIVPPPSRQEDSLHQVTIRLRNRNDLEGYHLSISSTHRRTPVRFGPA